MNRRPVPFAVGPVHFTGIGGIGMSGIAEIMLRIGYVVQGSDTKASANTDRLRDLGANVFIGHDGAHIEGASAVVYSTAVKPDNPEVVARFEGAVLEKTVFRHPFLDRDSLGLELVCLRRQPRHAETAHAALEIVGELVDRALDIGLEGRQAVEHGDHGVAIERAHEAQRDERIGRRALAQVEAVEDGHQLPSSRACHSRNSA